MVKRLPVTENIKLQQESSKSKQAHQQHIKYDITNRMNNGT